MLRPVGGDPVGGEAGGPAEAYGVVGEGGELLACIEVCPEEWSNRLTVTELWVFDALRGRAIGKRLMNKAKEIAEQATISDWLIDHAKQVESKKDKAAGDSQK